MNQVTITLTEGQYLAVRLALERALALLTEAEIEALNRRPATISGDADARREGAMRRLKEGADYKQVVAEFGIPRATAHRWMKQAQQK